MDRNSRLNPQSQQQSGGPSHSGNCGQPSQPINHEFLAGHSHPVASHVPDTLPPGLNAQQQQQRQQQLYSQLQNQHHIYSQHGVIKAAALQQNISSLPQRLAAPVAPQQQSRVPLTNFPSAPQPSQHQQQAQRPAFGATSQPATINSIPSTAWGVPNPLIANHVVASKAQVPAPSSQPVMFSGQQQIPVPNVCVFPGAVQSQPHRHAQQMPSSATIQKKGTPNPVSQQPPAALPPAAQLSSLPGQPMAGVKQATIVRPDRGGKPKLQLTKEAKQELGKAIWSAIKHPDGEISPPLMEAALRTGLPRHAILQAARVAREREAKKHIAPLGPASGAPPSVTQEPSVSSSQQPHQPVAHAPTSSVAHIQQHQSISNPGIPFSPSVTVVSSSGAPPSVTQQPSVSSSQQPHQPVAHAPASSVAHIQQHQSISNPGIPFSPSVTVVSSSHQQRKPKPVPAQSQMAGTVATNPIPRPVHSQQPPPQLPSKAPPPVVVSKPPVLTQAQQMQLAQKAENKAQTDERAEWKRVQSGVFMVQKERSVALPFTVGAMVRSSNSESAVVVGHKRPRDSSAELRNLQKQMPALQSEQQQARPTTELLDPEKFKRIKLEPKKHARALDRHARKARQNIAEALGKQLKDLHKQIVSHQSEFCRFHRSRRGELSRVCKAIRDTFDKEEKKKEKDAVQAEKARLAALRANDMTAYSKLLEETRNDRLNFLMEKTEKHFTKISSLLQQRSTSSDDAATNAVGASYYASAHTKTEEVRQPTLIVGGDLKAYQLTGLQWLVSLYNNNLNGILADEMGLGKTIQAISLIAYLMEFKQNLGPYLVIVPLSTLSNWQNEFAKWCPAARVVCYKGLPTERKEIFKEQVRSGQYNVLLTTYEYIIRDKKYLRHTDWQYAIVDEGHRMKNAESKFAVTLSSQYTTRHRILLTGTPLMNDLSELWSLLNFLLPTIFNSVETFDQWFSRPFASFGEQKQDENAEGFLSNEERILIIHRLHELLRPFMLRRVKSEVLDQLPEKVEKVLRCNLSSWQKELYKQISRKAATDSSIVAEAGPTRGLNNVVMQLRKVCNHPYLFSPEGYHINDTIVRSSGKMALLDQMLPKLKLAGHRVLLFTQMTAVMTILEDYFTLRGFLSLRLDGSTPAEERERRMYKFNSPDSPYFIFLLSTRAGGLGLNLTAADTVIIFDSDWNPMMDLQAQDRAHRIGQRSSNVSVFRLITNSPVEEKILSRATEKLNVSELVVESGRFNKESVESDNSLERRRLMEVLLTDFDAPQQAKGVSEKSGSDDEDGGEGSGASEKEDLNELLSNNEMDYQIYSAFDEEQIEDGTPPCELFVDENDVPDWILHPPTTGAATGNYVVQDMGDASRKRKAVTYDDGMTEKQFLRAMEKKAEEEEGKKPKKRARTNKSPVVAAAQPEEEEEEEEEEEIPDPSSALTDWTFRKLISCSKAVTTLKDPATKRKLAEIFLEKPDPATFPDYYELIEKPIAINDIQRKCRAKLYTSLQEFKTDWKLMFANAVKFNGEDSWVVEDARAIEKELERVLKKNGFSDSEVPISSKKKLRIKLSLKGASNSSS